MKFKGTIIITDPCYVINKSKEDDWKKSDYGHNMEVLGINTYFTEDTLCGDWNCTTYKITTNPYKVIHNFVQAQVKGEDYGVKCSKLGNFCADSGLVSVFLLDEVRKYNPSIDEWIENHDLCVTKIPNFDGEIHYYVDEQGCAHILGFGNINFFTD